MEMHSWRGSAAFGLRCCVYRPQYAVESQIRLRGFDPQKSTLVLRPRPVRLARRVLPRRHMFLWRFGGSF